MELQVDVNRKEQVDLVLSVYDESLLGVAPDRAKDIRDFFLADERVQHEGDTTPPRVTRLFPGFAVALDFLADLVQRLSQQVGEQACAGAPRSSSSTAGSSTTISAPGPGWRAPTRIR